MRIWTLHPKYLDSRGLVSLWREALLAQAVLRGQTRGYLAHPQLIRFRAQPDPVGSIADYLIAVHEEAVARGYRFDANKIGVPRVAQQMMESEGQLLYEWQHLKSKLQRRNPDQYAKILEVERPEPHPLFFIVSGGICTWERVAAPPGPRVRQPGSHVRHTGLC
jgi:hypothetical protein